MSNALKSELAALEARVRHARGNEKTVLLAQYGERIAHLKERIAAPADPPPAPAAT